MKSAKVIIVVAASWLTLAAQTNAPLPSMSRAPQPTQPFYVDPAAMASGDVVAAPPLAGSAAEREELAELHAVMSKASPQQTASAQTDAAAESIFFYASVLGPEFDAKHLPLTAQLSDHLVNDARLINLSLKRRFARPRPFVADTTLHPTCGLLREPSYPSGHAMNGYLLAFALMQMLPEKSDQILQRANEYAHNRIVCGEHYRSDLVAGKTVAAEIFGNILANPQYRRDLASARAETRKTLHLKPE